MINEEDIAIHIELQGVYDGWSIAKMKDGSYVNRWDKDTYPTRYAMTQEWIDKFGKDNAYV